MGGLKEVLKKYKGELKEDKSKIDKQKIERIRRREEEREERRKEKREAEMARKIQKIEEGRILKFRIWLIKI